MQLQIRVDDGGDVSILIIDDGLVTQVFTGGAETREALGHAVGPSSAVGDLSDWSSPEAVFSLAPADYGTLLFQREDGRHGTVRIVRKADYEDLLAQL